MQKWQAWFAALWAASAAACAVAPEGGEKVQSTEAALEGTPPIVGSFFYLTELPTGCEGRYYDDVPVLPALGYDKPEARQLAEDGALRKCGRHCSDHCRLIGSTSCPYVRTQGGDVCQAMASCCGP